MKITFPYKPFFRVTYNCIFLLLRKHSSRAQMRVTKQRAPREFIWRFLFLFIPIFISSLNCLLPAIWGRVVLVSTWRKPPLRLVRSQLNPLRLSKQPANQTSAPVERHVLLGLAAATVSSPTDSVMRGNCSFVFDVMFTFFMHLQ